MFTVIIFLVILSVLVVAHEWGHFVAARKSGMRVFEFGIGFPPRAVGFYKDPATGKWVRVGKPKEGEEYPTTVYSLNWLPLGGFCKIKGENGEQANDPDSFGHHKAWKRVTVLVAGVVMNVLLAAVIFSVGFTVGIPTDVSGGIPQGAIIVGVPSVVIQEVVKGSAAEEAKLQFGDAILAVDDSAAGGAEAFSDYVRRHTEQELVLRVKRGDEEFTVKATPRPILGIVLADAAIIRYPWYRALPEGFAAAGTSLMGIFISLYILLKQLILGQGLAFEVSGPVGIASIVGASARLGFQYLLHVTAMISLSLAAMNILPIPALDGGRVLFILIEKIIRRPVPMKYEQTAHTIGFVLLMILIVIVTGRDILGLVR